MKMAEKINDSDSLIEKANAAFRQAFEKVLLRAKLTGTPIVIWEDGQIKELPPEEMEAQEIQSIVIFKHTHILKKRILERHLRMLCDDLKKAKLN